MSRAWILVIALTLLGLSGCVILDPCGSNSREYCVDDECTCGQACRRHSSCEAQEVCARYVYDQTHGVCVSESFARTHRVPLIDGPIVTTGAQLDVGFTEQ